MILKENYFLIIKSSSACSPGILMSGFGRPTLNNPLLSSFIYCSLMFPVIKFQKYVHFKFLVFILWQCHNLYNVSWSNLLQSPPLPPLPYPLKFIPFANFTSSSLFITHWIQTMLTTGRPAEPAGLILFRPCTGSQRCSEFMRPTVVLCPEDSVSQKCTSLLLCSFCAFSWPPIILPVPAGMSNPRPLGCMHSR